MRQTAILLSDEAYDRLEALAAKAGRFTQVYIQNALTKYLDDQEDIELAEGALEIRQRGGSGAYSIEEVGRELGLDD